MSAPLKVFAFSFLEKEMATHSSVLAWRIPGTGKPVGLPSMGSHRVGHDWSGLAAAAEFLMSTKWGIKQNLQVGAKSPVSVIPGHASSHSGFGNLLHTLSVLTLFDLQHFISVSPVSDIGSQCSPPASLWVSRSLIILKRLPWWLWESLALVVYVMLAFCWGEREALANFFHPRWNWNSSVIALTSLYVPALASFYCFTSLFYALILATKYVGS